MKMCMLVFLLTTAFGPPRTGVGGSRRQLWGGSRSSGAGAAGFLSITTEEKEHCHVLKDVTVTCADLSGTGRPGCSSMVFSRPADDRGLPRATATPSNASNGGQTIKNGLNGDGHQEDTCGCNLKTNAKVSSEHRAKSKGCACGIFRSLKFHTCFYQNRNTFQIHPSIQ